MAGGALDVGGAANGVGGAVTVTTASVGVADRCALAGVPVGGAGVVGGSVAGPSCGGVVVATDGTGVSDWRVTDRDASAVCAHPTMTAPNRNAT